MLTFAEKGAGRRRQEELILHRGGLGAPRYARLHEIPLHPFGEPAHIAVAVQWVRAEGPINRFTHCSVEACILDVAASLSLALASPAL